MRKIISLVLVFVLSFLLIPTFVFATNTKEDITEVGQWMQSEVFYDQENKHFVLTEDHSSWQAGSIWYNRVCDGDFELEMDYYTGCTDRALGGADGIVVAFYANYSYQMEKGEYLGFDGCEGYGIELDTYCNSSRNDPEYNHIALIDQHVDNHLISAELPESEDAQWHHLKMQVIDGKCTVYIDDAEKFSYEVTRIDYGWLGITSATGNGENLHAVKNISITNYSKTAQSERKFLDIDLSHVKKTPIMAESAEKQKYEIAATITNNASVTATNVFATLDLSSGLSLDANEASQIAIGDIGSEESKRVTWQITADVGDESSMETYGVTAMVQSAVSLRQENYIYVSGLQPAGNQLSSQDTWAFSNHGNHFSDSYYLSETAYQALVANLSELEKDIVTKKLQQSWGGSCHGMSATTVLVKAGVMSPSDIQAGKNTLQSVTIADKSYVESFINFYQLHQYMIPTYNAKQEFSLLDPAEQLAIIEDLAEEAANGGLPFVLSFTGEGGGHSIVGYGVEHGSFSPQQTTYDSVILTYDCSNLDNPGKSYLYYNSGTDEWYIEQYSNDTSNWLMLAETFVLATNDFALLDSVNHDTAIDNYRAQIVYESNMQQFFLSHLNERYQIEPTTNLRDEGIVSYYDANIALGTDTPPQEFNVIVPAWEDGYTVQPANNEPLNISFVSEDVLISADVESIEQLDFHPNGEISGVHADGNYEISLVLNKDDTQLPWNKTIVKGADAQNISVKHDEEGIIISGDNLAQLTITVIAGDEEETLELSTEEASVLLKNDGTDEIMPVIFLDSDGDGIFEKNMNDAGDVTAEEEPANPSFFENHKSTILIVAVVLVLVVVLAVILVVLVSVCVVWIILAKKRK